MQPSGKCKLKIEYYPRLRGLDALLLSPFHVNSHLCEAWGRLINFLFEV